MARNLTRYHKIPQDPTRYHKIPQDPTRSHKIFNILWESKVYISAMSMEPTRFFDINFQPQDTTRYHKIPQDTTRYHKIKTR